MKIPNRFQKPVRSVSAGLVLLKEGKRKEAVPFIEKSEHLHKNDLIEKLEK